MNTFVISTSSFDTGNNAAVQRLISAGLQPVMNPYGRRLTEDEAAALLKNDVVGMIAGVEPLTARVIQSAKNLKVISRCGTGMDNVDLAAAKSQGITVLNTPEAPAQAVAELTLGFMLAALRRICATDREVRAGDWPRTQGGLLAAQTIGLIGLGHIGRRVARLCQAFEATVITHDPYVKQVQPGVANVSMAQLLESADVISLHTPYSPDLHHLIDAQALARMKPGAIVINTARGGLIDEDALKDALDGGRLSAAALDAFEQEPYQGPLRQYGNLILSSHVGSLAREARQRMELEAAENLLNGLINTGFIHDA
ncbi:D-3-phosphoglycerate dehydrogenase [Nitrosomonas sp. Nm51]|uniref:phosphoglycerate dehydrogenase n=1 Tax=Nitrosomonas sp. Nm51 TaxID=133720 RepID=UPI0008B9E5FA|nr:phosphoglycerate dehydrogenase [Nitrosomonas sp. Nm51]SER64243.1 D-3-phosphoglycerate dehydrogenase [Nitrosomonas sp. Nm51]